MNEIGCVYSPAKRRGPVPGKVGHGRKSNTNDDSPEDAKMTDTGSLQNAQALPVTYNYQDMALQQMFLMQNAAVAAAAAASNTKLPFNYETGLMDANLRAQPSQLTNPMYMQQLGAFNGMNVTDNILQSRAQRMKFETPEEKKEPDTITAHLPLLSRNSIDGNRLRSFYRLSIDELYALPPIPSDEEFCAKNNLSIALLPESHRNALQAARFAELALGAIVHNEISLAMELCNATVHSLRNCGNAPAKPEYAFELARAYFLLGAFRAFRGDMVRYFKYRRVCMTHLVDMETYNGTDRLFAAIAFLDAWAYMMYNANEDHLPNIDDDIPKVPTRTNTNGASDVQQRLGACCGAAAIASNPNNQMWIQGAPPVYLDNEAALNARSLDAIACAIRSCCDQANSRFLSISKSANPNSAADINLDILSTPTSTAVLANQNELCSRNMILSACSLLQQHESLAGTTSRHNQGHHLIITALDAFLDGGDEDSVSGFTDGQIQSLLSVCNTAIENPLLLYHGGPTYHMVSNATILLCHLLNGMHAMDASFSTGTSKEMEAAVFEEILDTVLSVRKLLNIHRRKLPVRLRCHAIPRPNMCGPGEGQLFIDLGETLMCGCRGCQGFVLMACSPCVAAERARAAELQREQEAQYESQSLLDINDLDRALYDLENEYEIDDDALLKMLSSIVTV